MDQDSLLDNVKKRLDLIVLKKGPMAWPCMACLSPFHWRLIAFTEIGVNAEGRDDDRLGQLPAPHPAIPSHVRVRGGPEEKPAAGEDSFVRSPNRRQIEGSHSPPHPPSLAGYPATTELSAIPTDFPTTYTSGHNNHFWGHRWRAVIPNCRLPFLGLLFFCDEKSSGNSGLIKGILPPKKF